MAALAFLACRWGDCHARPPTMNDPVPSAPNLLVTHVGTYDKTGGAALAAWRLHLGLRETGRESRVVSRIRSWPGDDVSCISSENFPAMEHFHHARVGPRQPPGSGYFSFAAVSIPLQEHPWIAAADVVHFHWIARFISPEDIERLCLAGKTVFMSLHDEWAFTGGSHYIGGTVRGEAEWNGIHQIDEGLRLLAVEERLRKKRVFSSLPIHVIAPSRWIAREAAASGVFAPERIHVVPYGFDLSIFHPAPDDSGARVPEEVVLAFGCQLVEDPRKGYRQFCEALVLCCEDVDFAAAVAAGKIRVVTFGKAPENTVVPLPVSHLGEMEEPGVAEVLRNASAFVCPTLDDNLPNVVMESLSCGTPVLGFSTGGVPDMVTEGVDGLLAPHGDVPALAALLKRFCLDAALRQDLRNGARAKDFSGWTLAAQADRITELYKSVIPSGYIGHATKFPDAPSSLELECPLLPPFASEITRFVMEESREQNRVLQYKIRGLEGRVADLQAQMKKKDGYAENLAASRAILLKKTDEQEKLIDELRKRQRAGIRKRLRRIWKSIRRRG